MGKFSYGTSFNTSAIRYDGNSNKRMILFVGLAMIFVSAATFGYLNFNSDSAKINRVASAYFNAQAKSDKNKMKSLETTSLNNLSSQVLGESTDVKNKAEIKIEDQQQFNVTNRKIENDSAYLLADLTYKDSKTEKTPVLIKLVKEDGKWKVDVYNIGLITNDEIQQQ